VGNWRGELQATMWSRLVPDHWRASCIGAMPPSSAPYRPGSLARDT
jgi:hypothetical protein